ncbi:hypothetical protein ASPWEDRAFT_53298 [Aspergillus wentii DTO 134E9]|uniref:Plasma membrane stress response protein n=1 Tax=Aspergillus wentii DTO 134E9 TaxID=1073089 RepID=A0A1L9REI6_ASPWE|nr:uncharacterized protein ASPWEDRAFT_53298 [Aspergillus wentii DTO 134E9]KAI9933539.1 hypothetical protein MW887_008012 [Aspergillus wentii]OJJ33287.1 hypothetical protein ASPWEDRAFT_53298 [Aspergillus wentii DTO 134E9]
MALFAGSKADEEEYDNFGVDWVVYYEFEDVDSSQATEEFRSLIHDLEAAGLRTQVRHGYGASLLICIKVPRDHLGNMVYKSRVKDWLYGIIHEFPTGGPDTIAESETPAEELRSVYHAVSWQPELGGAGIHPGHGKWENVSAAFPLHNQAANAELLRKWSRTTRLTDQDLDAIRALFGEKVAFYFAFIHCYSGFLIFPAAWGILCWFYFGPYSITSAIVNCIWCIVFVEYWKVREEDLSFRWNVKGVGVLKVDRIEYVWDKEVRDPDTGRMNKVFPARKQFLRQLLFIPFATVACLALGTLIVVTFGFEVFISEVYNGPFKEYLEFLPTVIFSLSLPAISAFLTNMATRLTNYENYRTQDQYDLAQTQKTFVMNFITSFLPTILTAFVYVPFGAKIVPYLNILHWVGIKTSIDVGDFHVDPSRLQQEVIYLSITAQVLGFGEELVLPYVKRVLWQKWRNYRFESSAANRKRSHSRVTDLLLIDPPDESAFLERVRTEAEADEYNVHDDILEMCVQFGYLALFGIAWPLVPLGFLLNNWLELRGDFFKLSLECQRPPPIRADSIGPSLQGLEFLTWLGTLSTATIVHLYRGPMSEVKLSSLLFTILVAEQAYLALQFAIRTGIRKVTSGTLRREAAKRYAFRKSYYDSMHGSVCDSPTRVKRPRVRFNERVNVYSTGTDAVWTDEKEELSDSEILYSNEREAQFWGSHEWETADAGVKLIRALSSDPEKKMKVKGKTLD